MTDTPAPAPQQTVVVAQPAPRATWRDIVPLIALAITLVTLLVGGGKVLANVADNTRRIVTLEQRADRRDDQLADLRAQIGKMDGKLDLLVTRTGTVATHR